MYYLQNNIEIVAGAKRFCIYDFNTEKMYSIDKDAMDIIEKIINNDFDADALILSNDVGRYLYSEGIIVAKENLISKINPKKYGFNVTFAWIEITQNCNLMCRHCYEGSSRVEKKPEMKFEDFRNIVDQLVEMGVKSVQLVGGEPLMHSQIMQMIDYVYEKFSYIEVYTNGTLLNDKMIELIKNRGITLAMSYYSEKNEIHDYVTRTPGSLKLTQKHISKAIKKEIPIRLAAVEMRDVPRFELKTFDVPFRFDLPRLTGRADISLYTKDMLKRKLITKKTFSKPINIEEFYKNKTVHNCFGERLYFDFELNVYPCAMERRICYGNARDKSIYDLAHDKFANMTKDRIKGCKDCEYRYACYDCRCDSNGDQIDAKPWYCTYDQENGIWINEDEFIYNLICRQKDFVR